MKKRVYFYILLSFIIFAITSCASNSGKSIEKTKFESREANIDLMGNPSTGYSWQAFSGDTSIITITGEIEYTGKNGIVGAPSIYHYTIHSVKEGTTTASFYYSRPWYEEEIKDDKNSKEVIYNITVEADGNIILIKK